MPWLRQNCQERLDRRGKIRYQPIRGAAHSRGSYARGRSSSGLILTRPPSALERALQPAVRRIVKNAGDAASNQRDEMDTSDFNAAQLFQNHPDPMWVYDAETLAFLAVNEAAIAQYGYSRAEFLAMSIADIRPAEDIDALHRSTARSGRGHSP